MRIAPIFLGIIVSGCTVTPKTHVVENQANSDFMPFIRDGVTERQEIVTRLGEAFSTYEGDRIVTYWVQQERDDSFRVVPMRNLPSSDLGGITAEIGLHNLVLVFDSNDVLERHSFVLIR